MSKKSLQDKIRELRELINSSICYKQGAWSRKDDGDWSKLWTAVDNVEDTQSAIDEYSSLKDFSRLAVYGLLQAMVVQQDGIKHLEEAIQIRALNFKKDYPDLHKIRDIRNETVGHPTNTKRKKGGSTYTSISHTNSLDILEYGVWSRKGFEHKTIRLKEIIDTQSKLLVKELDKVIAKIKKDETKHKKVFRGKSLSKMLAQTDYYIQKLWSFEKQRDYSRINFDFLKSVYEKFKEEIKQRYRIEKVDEHGVHAPGLIEEIKKVEKLLPRIERMIPMGAHVDEFDLDVYVESLNNAFAQLRVMSKEIDETFKV